MFVSTCKNPGFRWVVKTRAVRADGMVQATTNAHKNMVEKLGNLAEGGTRSRGSISRFYGGFSEPSGCGVEISFFKTRFYGNQKGFPFCKMHENRAKNQLPCASNTFLDGFCQITRVIPGSPSKNTHVNGYGGGGS